MAVAVGTLTALARQRGWLHGWWSVLFCLGVVLAVPTSRQLSRRILLSGCLLLGWLPVLWWWHLPLGGVGRTTVLLGLLTGALAGWVAGAPEPRARLRRLRPDLHLVDALPLLAATAASLVVSGWLQVRSGAKALAILVPGWDNSAHYDMVAMIRQHGVTVDVLPHAADGTAWAYANYPQGFHAATAGVMELMGSVHPGTADAEAVLFVHATALLFVALVAMTAAGISGLPGARRRPDLALPVVTLVTTAFVLGPGAGALSQGFANFLLASALTGCALLLAVTTDRPLKLLPLAALGGALLGVAHSWAPMLTLAVPAAAVIVLPWRRERWSATRATWGCAAAIGLATALGVLDAWRILSSNKIGTLLTTNGGIPIPPLGMVLALAVAGAGLCVALLGRGVPLPRTPVDDTTLRTGFLAAVPLCGLVTAAAVAAHQLDTPTGLSYYFWKYLTGLELVALVLVAAAVAARPPVARPARAMVPVVVSAALALAATQAFGYAGPTTPSVETSVAPGIALNQTAASQTKAPATGAGRLLSAVQVQAAHPHQRVVYLGFAPSDLTYALNAEQWYRALTRTWTAGAAQTGLEPALMAMPTLAEGVTTARRILAHSPDQLVVVGPEMLAPLRAGVTDPAQRRRIVTW